MENKLTKIVTILTVMGLMSCGAVAYAASQESAPKQDPGVSGPGAEEELERGPGGHHGRGPEQLFKDLNLTAEQKEKLKAQREAKKEEHKVLREQMKVKMQALHEAISKPESKRADVEGLIREVNVIKGKMFGQMIDGFFAMKEVLTPEQFAKMQAKHQERMNRKPKGWGRPEEGGPEGDQPEPPQD